MFDNPTMRCGAVRCGAVRCGLEKEKPKGMLSKVRTWVYPGKTPGYVPVPDA